MESARDLLQNKPHAKGVLYAYPRSQLYALCPSSTVVEQFSCVIAIMAQVPGTLGTAFGVFSVSGADRGRRAPLRFSLTLASRPLRPSGPFVGRQGRPRGSQRARDSSPMDRRTPLQIPTSGLYCMPGMASPCPGTSPRRPSRPPVRCGLEGGPALESFLVCTHHLLSLCFSLFLS